MECVEPIRNREKIETVKRILKKSGMREKHRNNHRGNRILNSILYATAILQIRYDEKGSAYYLKKLQEGKAKKVARKHLQRQLSNLIWKTLFVD